MKDFRSYWLEATDNNDFGRPNVGKSKSYKITIEEGLKPALEQKKERREAQRAQRALKALAEATGGEAFFPKDVSEVDRIAHQVARDVRNQYTIGYTPSNTALDGTFRQIKIAVRAPGNPTVRTRSGYYATPDQGAAPAKGTASK